jgi:hypothetical protein
MLSNWAESVGLRERAAAPQYTSSDVEGASASARAASRAEALANFDAREDDDDGADDAGGAIDKFRRRARRRSLTGTLDAGFTNFTSGIKTGWNVEAMSGKFRQVRRARATRGSACSVRAHKTPPPHAVPVRPPPPATSGRRCRIPRDDDFPLYPHHDRHFLLRRERDERRHFVNV